MDTTQTTEWPLVPISESTEWPLVPDLNNPLISNEAMETTVGELALLSKTYIHPRVLAFPTGAMKTNWIKSVKDAQKWDIFSAWFQASKSDAFVSIGCFSTWPAIWVRDKEWQELEWHTWGAALIKPEDGVRLKKMVEEEEKKEEADKEADEEGERNEEAKVHRMKVGKEEEEADKEADEEGKQNEGAEVHQIKVEEEEEEADKKANAHQILVFQS